MMSHRQTTSPPLPESTASEFLHILNSLHCPYTQDVDESYISELLFTPGEHRIRLMLWVFGEVESSVESMINSEAMIRQGPDLGVDKRVQFLTSLGASFGICRAADFDLIRGNSPFVKQLGFWKKLIRIVQYSKKQYLDDALSEDTHVMDQMLTADEAFMRQISQDHVNILPPNLQKEIKILLPNEKRKLGGFANLREDLERLREELEEQQKSLVELENSATYTTEDDKITLSNVTCKLDLTLNDIDQMMTAYEQVFSNSYLPYCNKEAEEFGSLGPLIQIVTKQLMFVANTFDRLISIRVSSESILKHPDTCVQTNEKLSRYASIFDTFLSQSVPCLEKLEGTMDSSTSGMPDTSSSQFAEQSVFASKLNESISNISSVF